MKVIQPQVYIESDISEKDAIMLIERAGRVCYKSENKIKRDSAETFIRGILKRGQNPSEFGNMADDNVLNYNYDFVFENNGELENLENDFMEFFEGKMLK